MADEDEPAGWSTPFGELTFDDVDPPDRERQRRNNRVLTIGIAVGALVVLGLGLVGVVLVRHYLDDQTSLTATMSARHARAYRHCVQGGGGRSACATRAEAACAADPGWAVEKSVAVRLREIGDTCLFGPDAGH